MTIAKCPPHRFALRQTTGRETCIDCFAEEEEEEDYGPYVAGKVQANSADRVRKAYSELGAAVEACASELERMGFSYNDLLSRQAALVATTQVETRVRTIRELAHGLDSRATYAEDGTRRTSVPLHSVQSLTALADSVEKGTGRLGYSPDYIRTLEAVLVSIRGSGAWAAIEATDSIGLGCQADGRAELREHLASLPADLEIRVRAKMFKLAAEALLSAPPGPDTKEHHYAFLCALADRLEQKT